MHTTSEASCIAHMASHIVFTHADGISYRLDTCTHTTLSYRLYTCQLYRTHGISSLVPPPPHILCLTFHLQPIDTHTTHDVQPIDTHTTHDKHIHAYIHTCIHTYLLTHMHARLTHAHTCTQPNRFHDPPLLLVFRAGFCSVWTSLAAVLEHSATLPPSLAITFATTPPSLARYPSSFFCLQAVRYCVTLLT